MKKYILHLLTFAFSLFLSYGIAQQNYSDHVDPMIGTGGHGHTFPGATVPFGMVQLSPDTRIDGSWDGCSGYHHSDSIIYGFSHTHLSGTGCSDFGDIVLMPFTKAVTPDELLDKKISSTFSHKNEKATAGYYAVNLDNGVKAELTASTRVGFHKYTFPKSEFSYIILDLELRDKVIGASASLRSKTNVTGYRQSEAWAKNQTVMYNLEFSEPFIDATTFSGSVINQGEPVSGTKVRICFKFKTPANNVIMTKVSLSPVTIEGAVLNMKTECAHWDFEKTKKEAEASWNKELSKIEVTSTDKDKLKIFYTALYHTMIQPNVAMDVDGMYRGRDDKSHKAEGYTYYSVFSLWDTFRAAHPLYTIIDQKRTSDFINTFLAQYEQGGRLPVWELASNETDCMIGYHSVSVIADAMVKGIKGFDYEKAYQASKHSAMLDHLGLKAYKQNGFIAMEDEHESVSKTLEYAYDDWCIAQMALILKKDSDYQYFMKRSQSWKNVFDTETGFMRPKKNGGWLTPFEPREVNNNFTEGNSWQYTFFVPQDMSGLISMMGGSAKFEKKLDELFTTSSQTTGREQADITGLIGQYAHGNEPSHHMAYLYNYVSNPSKTQQRVHQILTDLYKPAPDGLIGNEDCGQMSAWYVLNSIGLYSVTPGGGNYMYGTPNFNDIKIHLENGKQFEIKAPNLSSTNYYVQSYYFDDVLMPRLFFSHSSMMMGGVLTFEMVPSPVKWTWDNTISIGSTDKILPVPIITTASRVFEDSLLVTINSSSSKDKIEYATIDSISNEIVFTPYKKPFSIGKTKIIYAFSKNKYFKSDTISGSFYKRPNDWKVDIKSKYNPQYTAGGDEGLIDGLRGDVNWRKGEWQGYQYQDFEAVVDLGSKQKLSSFEAGFLQDSRSWILMPSKVEFYASGDNKEFVLIGTETHKIDPKDELTQIKKFVLSNEKVKARYIKVKAYNFGKLPEWHLGYGDSAFIFIDEITIK